MCGGRGQGRRPEAALEDLSNVHSGSRLWVNDFLCLLCNLSSTIFSFMSIYYAKESIMSNNSEIESLKNPALE